METFVAVTQPSIDEHPPVGDLAKGNWANLQIGFIPDASDNVVRALLRCWCTGFFFALHHQHLRAVHPEVSAWYTVCAWYTGLSPAWAHKRYTMHA